MYTASKSGIIDLRKPSLIGVVSFKNVNTGLKQEVKVYRQFWNKQAYLPSSTEIYDFLYSEQYRHASDARFKWVM
jgi:hypothetical protein